MSVKRTTNTMQRLDVRRLHRDGLLIPGRAFSWQWMRLGEAVTSIQIRPEIDRVILSYQKRSHSGEWQPMEYPVYLEWTPCNLGGRRVWFQCPAKGCGRRVAVLYGGSIFACRHCHKLAYECQRETEDSRAMRRANTIRQRMGWMPGVANLPGGKPKGMHWRTYGRLIAEHNAFANASMTGFDERLGRMSRKMASIAERLDLLKSD